jgi:hypothetical protein
MLDPLRGGVPDGTMVIVTATTPKENEMPTTLRRVRVAIGGLVAEDRREFKRIDASPARYDDGSWLKDHH